MLKSTIDEMYFEEDDNVSLYLQKKKKKKESNHDLSVSLILAHYLTLQFAAVVEILDDPSCN